MTAITADALRKLAALNLDTEQMAGVLNVLADVQAGDEQRKRKQRERTAKHRAKNVTVTLQSHYGNGDALQNDVDPLTSNVENNLKPLEKEKDPKGSQKKEIESDWPADFEQQVWQAYGQGREKKSSMEALKALRKSRTLGWIALMDAIRLHAENVESQFRPALHRWIKRERWLDEYEPEATGPPLEAKSTQRSLTLVNGNHHHVQAPRRSATQHLRADIEAELRASGREDLRFCGG